MTKQSGVKFGALAFLVAGMAIGYMIADGRLSTTSPALAQVGAGSKANEAGNRKTPTGLVQAEDPPSPDFSSQPMVDGLPAGLQ